MPARIPLDVDLEDKLLYGLTPMRLGYIVVALLAAFAIWSSHLTLAPMRAGIAIAIGLAGAVAAWGRWRGRPTDGWLIDIAIFGLGNYRLSWNLPKRLVRSSKPA